MLLVPVGIGVLSGVAAAAAPVAPHPLEAAFDAEPLASASASAKAPAVTPSKDPAPVPSPSKPPPPPATQVVIIGDSLSTGHGTSPDLAWPNLVQNDTRAGQHPLAIVNAATDGSGYVSTGDGGSTFLSEVDASVQKTTQMVLVFGSENDMGADSAQLKQAATNTLAEIAAKAPAARIVVVGPPSYTNDPEPSRLQVRDEDRAAATEAGAVFIDPIQEQWIMGQATQLIGPDGDHPSVEGQHYLQETMERVIAGNLPG